MTSIVRGERERGRERRGRAGFTATATLSLTETAKHAIMDPGRVYPPPPLLFTRGSILNLILLRKPFAQSLAHDLNCRHLHLLVVQARPLADGHGQLGRHRRPCGQVRQHQVHDREELCVRGVSGCTVCL